MSGFSLAVGQIPGTGTNDNAIAGSVREYATANVSGTTATVTFTNASPTVVTWTAHPYTINGTGIVAVGAINFTNSGGALPTGITAGTNYYAIPIDANTLHIATTAANAIAGTFVNTSSTGTGTQTGDAHILAATGSAKTLAAMALTAGDWEVYCTGVFVGTATTVGIDLQMSISSTDNVKSNTPGDFGLISGVGFSAASANLQSVPSGIVRRSLSATTNVYCNANNDFTTSTLTVYGFMRARRV